MKRKFSLILTLLLALTVQLTYAQQKSISGSVTDNEGMPLPGVNIIVKGTTVGTQTDFDGKYVIETITGQTLVFSYVGFTTVEKQVNDGTKAINVKLSEDAAQLTEVVLTAQGIKKEKKALGYAVSTVDEAEIKNNPETDLTRILQGKAAGIDITTQNGLSGSANKVIIRGLNSFSGSNNALYIVDGVPFSNDTNESGNFVDGNNGSSRSFDLDPSNIASIDILKGLAATTLYGSEGRNGVILITTKTGNANSGSSRQEIEISSSYFVNKVAALPDYQNKFGGGFDQAYGLFYSNWGPGFYKDGLGGYGTYIDDTDTNPNQPFHSDGTLPHPYSTSAFLNSYPDFKAQYEGVRYKWEPKNAVEKFFRAGGVASIAANIRGNSMDNKFNYGLSFAHVDDQGFTPENEVQRSNLTIAGGTKLYDRLSIKGSLTYTLSNYKTPPVAASNGSSVFGAGSSIFGDLLYTPRNIDFFDFPFQLPDGSSIYYRDDNAIQHPLWTLQNARFSQKTNRVNGYGGVDYELTDNLTLSYQASVDTYSELSENRQNKGGVTGNPVTDSGFITTYNTTNTIYDHRVTFSGNNFSVLNDNLAIDFLVGATSRGTDFGRIGVTSNNQQVFGFYDHSGFVNHDQIEFHEKRNIVGVYGQVGFDIKSFLYLNFAGRNDWVSNAINNSLFYPSASLSFVPTSAFPGIRSENGLSFLKLRAGYGTSANFATGYPTVTTVVLNPTAFTTSSGDLVTSNTTSSSIGNKDIKPELFSELEFGLETKLFNRINLDVSYYDRTTKDLIIEDRPIPSSTGASFTDTNIGEIKIHGYEAEIGIDVLKGDGLNWNVGANFSKNKSEVTDLGVDSDLIIYAGFTNLGNGARVGYPLGAIYGSRIARDEQGNLLVDATGNYASDDLDEEGILPFIGDPNPDFIMNYNSTLSYKGFSLNVAVNHTSGGDFYATTVATLIGRGLTTDTEDRLNTFILPGVSQSTGLPNDIQINNSDFYFTNGFASVADELSIYDASVVRLREVSLGYSFPADLLDSTPFKQFSIKFSGYNLYYNAYNLPDGTNFDPNVAALGAGNGQGFDFLTGPSSKRYGVSINATF